jgi:Sulfotransferase family
LSDLAAPITRTPTLLADRRIVYCVGAQRGGTSWLHSNVFKGHRDLHVPVVKETHYWDGIRSPNLTSFRERADEELASWQGSAIPVALRKFSARNPRRISKLRRSAELRAGMYRDTNPAHPVYAAYLLEGAKPGQLLVDNTPAYALLEPSTYAEMAGLGDARFIFIMRDPVSRLWSGVRHRMSPRVKAGKATDADVVARFTRVIDKPDLDFSRSDYKRTIEALESVIERDRILYLFHETMFDQSVADRVTAFLGIGQATVSPGKRRNKGIEVRVGPDDGLLARARERLAPVYDFVRTKFGDDVPAKWMK